MDVDQDNERHRREEQERRAKRKAHRESKAKSESQTEKERKRKEHAQRILQAQNKRSKPSSSSKKKPSSTDASSSGGSSIFQSLFHQRAQGFIIDLKFRNAPPRPPVGPCFVGLGLEGELTDKWTKYKARNAVERQYVWKVHAGGGGESSSSAGLGVPYLAVSALDWEGCYTDPDKKKKQQQQQQQQQGENENDDSEAAAAKGDTTLKDGSNNKQANKVNAAPPTVHPDDDALIHWKGSTGDTAAEQLQQRRDRARAAARLAIAQGHAAPLPLNKALTPLLPNMTANVSSSSQQFKLKAKNHLQSRILDEKTPNFMKKTTYLTNDATSVHRFTSLAKTQEERARDIDRAIADTKSRYSESDVIEKGFGVANSYPVIGGGSSDDETNVNSQSKQKVRVHPTKKNVTPVWDLPLLPDVPTWGQVYTHVVMDNPPKSLHHQQLQSLSDNKKKNASSSNSSSVVNAQQLEKAIVADVIRQEGKQRMLCTVWVPENKNQAVANDNDDTTEEKKNNDVNEQQSANKFKGDLYQAVQRYDLDVLPLRDASGPAVHFVLNVDPTKKYVGYHPIGSRIQLSTGRPVVLAGSGDDDANVGSRDSEIATDKTYIERRDMESEEKQDVEKRSAEVDIDLAKKYGLVDDDDDEDEDTMGRNKSSGAFGRSNSGNAGNNDEYDKKDEEAEDTF